MSLNPDLTKLALVYNRSFDDVAKIAAKYVELPKEVLLSKVKEELNNYFPKYNC